MNIINGRASYSGKLKGDSELVQFYFNNRIFECVLDTGVNNIELFQDKNKKWFLTKKSKSSQFYDEYSQLRRSHISNKTSESLSAIYSEFNQYKNDYFSLLLFNTFINTVISINHTKQSMDCFNQYSLNLRNSPLGEMIYKRLSTGIAALNRTEVGKKVPSFRLQTYEGGFIDDKSLEGTPYVLAFSATWCIPCMQIQPKLLQLYHTYRSKGLKVVYLNLDDNRAVWTKHIKDKNLDWINVSEGTKFKDSKIAPFFMYMGFQIILLLINEVLLFTTQIKWIKILKN